MHSDSHLLNVARLIKNKPEALDKLYEEPVDNRRTGQGPIPIPYAQACHRRSYHISGANLLLLNELVSRQIKELDHEPKRNEISPTKTLNKIVEEWLEFKKNELTVKGKTLMNNPIKTSTRTRIKFADGKIMNQKSELTYARTMAQIVDYLANKKFHKDKKATFTEVKKSLGLTHNLSVIYNSGNLTNDDETSILEAIKTYNITRQEFLDFDDKYSPNRPNRTRTIPLDTYLRTMYDTIIAKDMLRDLGLSVCYSDTIYFSTFAKMYTAILVMGGHSLANTFIPEGFTLEEVLATENGRIKFIEKEDARGLRDLYMDLCKERKIRTPDCYLNRPDKEPTSFEDAYEMAIDTQDNNHDDLALEPKTVQSETVVVPEPEQQEPTLSILNADFTKEEILLFLFHTKQTGIFEEFQLLELKLEELKEGPLYRLFLKKCNNDEMEVVRMLIEDED